MKTKIFIITMLIALYGNVLVAQKVDINTEKSSVKWMGKKIGSKHEGMIQLKDGYVELQDDKMVAAKIVIDMASITNTDLENENYNQKLVGHLKSDDFFGVETYPTASFELTKSSTFTNGKATLSGDITIKDKTEPISFDVVKEGETFSTKVTIDRSKFDVRFGSKSFFNNLGDNVIDDNFTLDIRLVVN
jgi:polyisoprenoid-binding protein YceI